MRGSKLSLEVADIENEVVVAVLNAKSSSLPHSNAAGWVYGVVRRAVARLQRIEIRNRKLGTPCDELAAMESAVSEYSDPFETRRIAMDLFRKEFPEYHEIVQLMLTSPSRQQLASYLGCTVQRVKSKLEVIRAKAKVVLGRLHAELN
ncbi:MAG: hypothetical protein AAGA30_08645 [Planctomycetota bacterium]